MRGKRQSSREADRELDWQIIDWEEEARRRQRMAVPEGKASRREGARHKQRTSAEEADSQRKAARQRQKQKLKRLKRLVFWEAVCIFALLCVLAFTLFRDARDSQPAMGGAFSGIKEFLSGFGEERIQGIRKSDYEKHPVWQEDFLTVNPYSRPGTELERVESVFVHYTANPGTSAVQNRSYFEQQKDVHERSVSAHFIIGYQGEIIQCVPMDEIAFAVKGRNEDSVSIECCYLSDDGSFTQETYDSLVSLLRWLKEVYRLDVEKDILRHYDCGGKLCPVYYVENEDAWERLKEDVAGA